jgi:hypothetical protein
MFDVVETSNFAAEPPVGLSAFETDDWAVVDQSLLAGLELVSPGLMLAAILSSVDRDRLSGYDRVSLLKARARQIAHDQAEFYAELMAVAVSTEEALGQEFLEVAEEDCAAWEVRAALMLTRRSAECHVELAWNLVERLPSVWLMLDRGGDRFGSGPGDR